MSWPGFWVNRKWQSVALSPISYWVCNLAKQRLKKFNSVPPEPIKKAAVIVVGNIVVGGSGKTPFIQWLAKQLDQASLSYGIVSRGYGGKSKHWPLEVFANSNPSMVGDEPVLLAASLGCPVVVAPKRLEAIALLQKQHSVDVIISDDGLQHFAMPREIEVVLMDAKRLLGNEMCLPSGPLREPKTRLDQVDFIVFNGGEDAEQFNMRLSSVCFRQVNNPKNKQPLSYFANQSIQAVAGIGNPTRFFKQLSECVGHLESHPFADHRAYQSADFEWVDSTKPLIMTQKDAVKCTKFAKQNWWYLEVEPICSQTLSEKLIAKTHQHLNLKRD